MAVDKTLEQELTNQIELLGKLKAAVEEGIRQANDDLKKVQAGQSREQVFQNPE